MTTAQERWHAMRETLVDELGEATSYLGFWERACEQKPDDEISKLRSEIALERWWALDRMLMLGQALCATE